MSRVGKVPVSLTNGAKVEISGLTNGVIYRLIATVTQANTEGSAKEKILATNTEYITVISHHNIEGIFLI